MELLDFASGFFQLALCSLAHFLGAGCVEQDAHRDARACALRKRIRDAFPEHAFFPQEGLEMHAQPGSAYLFEKHVEKPAVLDNLDRIALDEAAVQVARKGAVDGAAATEAGRVEAVDDGGGGGVAFAALVEGVQ